MPSSSTQLIVKPNTVEYSASTPVKLRGDLNPAREKVMMKYQEAVLRNVDQSCLRLHLNRQIFSPPCLSCLRNPRSHFFFLEGESREDVWSWALIFSLCSLLGLQLQRRDANTAASEHEIRRGMAGAGGGRNPGPHPPHLGVHVSIHTVNI